MRMSSFMDSMEIITECIDTDRSPSQVSDCYSNEGDYNYGEVHTLSHTDNNVPHIYKRKLNISKPYSEDISDNINDISNSNDATNFVQSNFETSLCNQFYKSDYSHFILGGTTSSEYNRINKKYSAGNIYKVTNDDVTSSDNGCSVTLSTGTFRTRIDANRRAKENIEACDTIVSNSLFETSRMSNIVNVSSGTIVPKYICCKSLKDDHDVSYSSIVPLETVPEFRSSGKIYIADDINSLIKVKGCPTNNPQIKNSISCLCKRPILTEVSTQTAVINNQECLIRIDDNSINEENIRLGKFPKELKEADYYSMEDVAMKVNGNAVNINSTIDILNAQVKIILSHLDRSRDSESTFPYPHTNYINDTKEMYSENSIMNFFFQIKNIYSLLDCKLNSKSKTKKKSKPRVHSDDLGDTVCIHESGDVINDLETDQVASTASMHVELKNSYCRSDYYKLGDNDKGACRIFELNPYDDLIKSHQSQNDRRLKAVSQKMKCKIIISGPICMFDSTNECWNGRNKTAFKCTIMGTTKEVVNKCLKCLQETFPQSCLNEKRIIIKSDIKTCVY